MLSATAQQGLVHLEMVQDVQVTLAASTLVPIIDQDHAPDVMEKSNTKTLDHVTVISEKIPSVNGDFATKTLNNLDLKSIPSMKDAVPQVGKVVDLEEESLGEESNNQKNQKDPDSIPPSPVSPINKKDLLERRPLAPSHLNLAFNNLVESKTKDAEVPRSPASPITQTSPTKPLSPKIMELRRSESYREKNSNPVNENIVTQNPVLRRANTVGRQPLSMASRGRHWALARGVIKSTLIFRQGEKVDKELLARLEQENSKIPPQNSAEFLLARLEKQNELLDNDPKSVCIESNILKANFQTVQSLIDDITSPTNETFSLDSPTHEESEDEATSTIDWEFWTALIQDYTGVATRLPHLLAAKIQQGLPASLRGLIWQSMCQASSTYLETMYSQLLEEPSPYDRIIQRDLARTFPHIDLFKEEGGEGQTMLWNVLRAYSLYDPLVGYCQGLGFLVGPLLMNMNEAQAFSVFVRLMETYDMRTMFTLNMEGLQLRLYQFSTLLSQILPKLHAHFQLHAVQAAMFASQWFLSLFAYTYPLPLVLRIYDVVFAEGAPETIMRVAIALLQKNEAALLDMGEFEDLLDFLTTKLYESYDNKPTGLIKDAMGLSSVITKVKLDELADTYAKELEAQKRRAEELAAARFNNRFGKKDKKNNDTKPKRWSLAAFPTSKHSASDGNSPTSDNEPFATTSLPSPPPSAKSQNTMMLHQQIEDLVNALSELQKEHADITEQLVNMKMEKMDLVTEVEGLRSRLREVEKQNKRMSAASSMFSIDSATASVDDARNSTRRTSVNSASLTFIPSEDADVTPRASTEVTQKNTEDSDNPRIRRTSILSSTILLLNDPSSNSSSTVTSNSSVTDISEFDSIDLSDVHKIETSTESAITQELIQVKMEKFELMQENDDLQRRVEELRLSLNESQDATEALQEKNVFLCQEIERLDEEAATAIYEQHSMERDVREFRELKLENVKLFGENENLKNQVEALQEKIKLLQDLGDESGGHGSNLSIDKAQGRASKRISFMSLFSGGNLSPKPNLIRATSDPVRSGLNFDSEYSIGDDQEYAFICKGECGAAKQVEEAQRLLSEYKSRLIQSEEARESMGSQLDSLRHLINGFTEDVQTSITPDISPLPSPIEDDSHPVRRVGTPEKQSSRRSSLKAFFSSAGI